MSHSDVIGELLSAKRKTQAAFNRLCSEVDAMWREAGARAVLRVLKDARDALELWPDEVRTVCFSGGTGTGPSVALASRLELTAECSAKELKGFLGKWPLDRLTHLEIVGDDQSWGDEHADVIVARGMPALESLSIQGAAFRPVELLSLLRRLKAPGLRDLRCEGTGIGRMLGGTTTLTMLEQLEYLGLRRECMSRGHVINMLASHDMGLLLALDLGENPIGDDGACAIARFASVRCLETLELAGCAISNEGASALVGSTTLDRLTVLDLSRNMITCAGVEGCASRLARLEMVLLDENPLEFNALLGLMASEPPRALRALSISGARLVDEPLDAPDDAALGGSVSFLNLSGSRLGDDRFAALASLRRLVGLRRLLASDARLGPASMEALVASSLLASTTWIDLSHNPVGDAGVRALMSAHDLSHLQVLDLSHCRLGDDACAALAERADLSGLEELRLDGNALSLAGIRALVRAPWFHAVKVLSMEGCGLTDRCLEALSTQLPHSMRELHLRHNSYGDYAVLSFIKGRLVRGLCSLSIDLESADANTFEFFATTLGLQRLELLDVGSPIGENAPVAQVIRGMRAQGKGNPWIHAVDLPPVTASSFSSRKMMPVRG